MLIFATVTMWLLLSLLLCPALALRTREPPVPTRASRSDAQELWLDVYLNQFMAYNTEKFPMRFYYNKVNETYQNIVINVGAEWQISPGLTEGGLPYEVATEVEAAVFYTEHRYFGKTRPTADTSVENLKYLTVNQALRDLVQFINYIKSDEFENGHYKSGKVVLVGCSLAGTMATWMRTAYPHLIDAAISDSGPVHAEVEFIEYLEVVAFALRSQGGDACLSSIEEGVIAVREAATSSTGRTQIQQLFNTCTVLAENSPLDLATFFWFGITETFAGLVQYASPGNIEAACEELTDTSKGNAMQRLAAWISEARDNKDSCLETRYYEMLEAYSNTSYDAATSTFRLWTYMECVELGWFQTTASSVQPFQNSVPLDFFIQMCQDFFSSRFTESRVQRGVELTNTFFGGHDFIPDYVVTVLGSHDPWSPKGPLPYNATHNSPVFMLEGESHCRTFGSTADNDPEELKRVKRSVIDKVKSILTGEEPAGENSATQRHVSVALLLAVAYVLFV